MYPAHASEVDGWNSLQSRFSSVIISQAMLYPTVIQFCKKRIDAFFPLDDLSPLQDLFHQSSCSIRLAVFCYKSQGDIFLGEQDLAFNIVAIRQTFQGQFARLADSE